jgi:hypothetical protein
MVSVLAGSSPDRVKPDYQIGICCFSAKHAALRRKRKDWLARNQDTVSEWGDMFIRGLLFQWASTVKNPSIRVGLVQSGPHHHLIENYRHDITEKLLTHSLFFHETLQPRINYGVQRQYLIPDDVFGKRMLSIASGFLVPFKSRGSIRLVDLSHDSPGKPIEITLGTDDHQWFYHRVLWLDMNGDGRKDAVTCRGKKPILGRFYTSNWPYWTFDSLTSHPVC